jgi:hypothetical protein
MERTSIERTVKTLACGITIDVHHVVGERSHNSLLDLRKTSEKLIRKASGSSGANTLAHVSWEGIPWGSGSKRFNYAYVYAYVACPYASISTQEAVKN